MNYKIFTIPPFDKQFKRLIKKYPSLKKEFLKLVSEIQQNPKQGDSMGKDCYKIRVAIASKGKGKRGGARVVLNVVIDDNKVYLLSIYDKSEKADLTDKELSDLLSYVI
jgi:mRNA-degrading endonuclease RelE of RelBE toxin-antitoxin system